MFTEHPILAAQNKHSSRVQFERSLGKVTSGLRTSFNKYGKIELIAVIFSNQSHIRLEMG